MPYGKILPYHALKTLEQLHAELGGKIEGNRKAGDKLRLQMMQLEAVMKMLDPDVNLRAIAVKRRNQGNPSSAGRSTGPCWTCCGVQRSR